MPIAIVRWAVFEYIFLIVVFEMLDVKASFSEWRTRNTNDRHPDIVLHAEV